MQLANKLCTALNCGMRRSRTWICTQQAKFGFSLFCLESGFVKMSAAVEPLNKLGRSSLKGKQPRVERKGENVF